MLQVFLQDFFESSSRNSSGDLLEISPECLRDFLHSTFKNFSRVSLKKYSAVAPVNPLEFLQAFIWRFCKNYTTNSWKGAPSRLPFKFLLSFCRNFSGVLQGITQEFFKERLRSFSRNSVGVSLGFCIEFLQEFLPFRVPSEIPSELYREFL